MPALQEVPKKYGGQGNFMYFNFDLIPD